jgi:hypothetical protein
MSKKKKEYMPYDGLYSLSWTDEQVAEYKKSKIKPQKTVDDMIKNESDEPEESEVEKDEDKKTSGKKESVKKGKAEKKEYTKEDKS